jgi:hypothetical protein
MEPAAILRAFANLTSTGTPPLIDVTASDQPLAWLGVRHSLFVGQSGGPAPVPMVQLPPSSALDRLALLDVLHRQEHLLREGWVFLCGTVDLDGTPRSVCVPILSRPVRLTTQSIGHALMATGDAELLRMIGDHDRVRALTERADFGQGYLWGLPYEASQASIDQLGSLRSWIAEVVDAAGMHLDAILGPAESPLEHRDGDGLVAIVGSGVFLGRDLGSSDLSSRLLRWAAVDGIDDTAFAAMYTPTWSGESHAAGKPADLRSSLPLTARQREVMRRARHERVTAVSGPPGNGKSHTVLAVALDAISRGEHVLIATQSDHAVDVLAEMLARQAGPTPITFGSASRRDRIASELGAGLGPALSAEQLDHRRRSVSDMDGRVRRLERSIEAILARELHAEDLEDYESMLPELTSQVPGAFRLDADLEALLDLATQAAPSVIDPFGGWRQARAEKKLREELHADEDTPLDVLGRALLVSRARRAAAELASLGGTALGSAWEELARADAELALGVGSLVSDALRSERALNPWSRRAVASLAAALRADRGRRRQMLETLDGRSLLSALPLWLGTLRDIEDLLPPYPGLFDLVILDEASQIDQLGASLALLRARRAVVVGDPHQLRHLPYVAALDLSVDVGDPELAALADQLDVGNSSAFDTAAGASAVIWLDEHFRSVPHLIEFSAERFYAGAVQLMTRHPRNEQIDAITVVRVGGTRDATGVNQVELQMVGQILDELAERGSRNIGVLSPFDAQASALEALVLDSLTVAEAEALDLRVGPVQAFQGSERDIVIVSLAIDGDDSSEAFRLLEDSNLFNVMVTRARKHMIVVTSLEEGSERFGWFDPSTRHVVGDEPLEREAAVRSLLGDYLRYAEEPPEAPPSGVGASAWTDRLAEEVARLGVAVRRSYPVGEWSVDLCIGDGARALGIECSVHPAGVAVHLARHRALVRAGWRLVDAFPSRWDANAAAAAVGLVTELRQDEDPRR